MKNENESQSTLNHIELLASLPDEARLELTRRSDRKGLMFLGGHLLAFMLTTVWILKGWLGWQLIMLLQGIHLAFLFTLLHETAHDTPFKSLWLNRWVGWVCALVLFLPPQWFRYYHLAHHRHTHDPEKDPELQGKQPETFGSYLWTLTGIPIWRFHFTTLFGNALGKVDHAYLPQKAKPRIIREARVMLGIYGGFLLASILIHTDMLVFVWLLPLLLGQPFLRAYLMAEHGRCPHVANMLENSRTTFTNRIVRWLAWNMPYHAEHHAWPTVPFHNLPQFHAYTSQHLKTTEQGYRKFHEKHVRELRG